MAGRAAGKVGTPAPPAPLDEPLLPGVIDHYLVADVPVCAPEATAADIRRLLRRGHAVVAEVAVCRPRGDGAIELQGLVPVATALVADDDAAAAALMDPDPPVVAPGLDQERAAWKAAEHGGSSLAVVDESGAFRGLVPAGRLLAALLHEHDVDLARLGGYLRSTASSRRSLDEPMLVRLWHRLPWLLVGLVGSAVAAWLVRGFEDSLSADVRLAFFIPGIVYMASAVGTQTEMLVVRGLAVGVGVRRVFTGETLTGLVVGVLLAAVAGPVAGLVLDSARIGVALALSLITACAIATVIAILLPWLMSRRGSDPAFGSGPLATVVQDLLSLVVYFSIVSAIVV